LPAAGTLEQTGSYVAGENKLTSSRWPAGVLALEVRLNNPVGSPSMALRDRGRFPRNGTTDRAAYGISLEMLPVSGPSLITIANPRGRRLFA